MNQSVTNGGCCFCLKVESSSVTADRQGWKPELSHLLPQPSVGHIFGFVLEWRFIVDILAQLFSPILAVSVQHVELPVKAGCFRASQNSCFAIPADSKQFPTVSSPAV